MWPKEHGWKWIGAKDNGIIRALAQLQSEEEVNKAKALGRQANGAPQEEQGAYIIRRDLYTLPKLN